MRQKVVFVTPVFHDAQTGPGIYAQYLWKAFKEDPLIEFHVVAPVVPEVHPQLHSAGKKSKSIALYRNLQKVAKRIVGRDAESTIVHGNVAHTMFDFVDYPGRWYAQINDYDVAAFWHHAARTLRQAGLARTLSLAWRRHQERAVLATVTKGICNSMYTQSEVEKAYDLTPGRCHTIYKAVDLSRFCKPTTHEELPTPNPQPHEIKRIVFVGTNWQRKGMDVMLQAFAHASRQMPELYLTVVGAESARMETRAHAVCLQWGISDRVEFLGRVEREDLPAVLWSSDLFVLPTKQEALGVAILEAMAAGIPVIASNVGGIPEIVLDESVGLLCDPFNYQALGNQIIEIMSDPERHARIITAGKKRVEEFSVNNMINNVRALYAGDLD